MHRHKALSYLPILAAGAVALSVVLFRPSPVQAITLPFAIVDAHTQRPVSEGLVRISETAEVSATISQKDKAFTPTSITIHVGQTIEILNDDNTVHNAFCSSGSFKYNAGPQQPGASSKVSFTTAGTYQVRCAIHPKMLLTVTVAE
jgi:plastocyanin